MTVVTPTYDRPQLLIERALPSLMAQTHEDWQWLVVGDGATPATVAAMATVEDPRVRFVQRPRSRQPSNAMARWRQLGAAPAAWGIGHAEGEFVTCLGDDDALMPRYIQALLELGSDAAYGRAEVVGHGLLGSWPVRHAHIQFALWRRSLGFNVDPLSWKRGEPADWNLWRRMRDAGVAWKFTEEVLYRYFPAHRVPTVDSVL